MNQPLYFSGPGPPSLFVTPSFDFAVMLDDILRLSAPSLQSKMVRHLLAIPQNLFGLRPKINEVRDFVIEHNLDVFLVQETWLQPGHTAFIANYRCYRNDRIRLGARVTGGTAIYIKNHFDHNSILTPDLDLIDATILGIEIGSTPPLKIISAYVKPNLRGGFPLEEFKKLLNSGQNVIVAGDLNDSHINWHNYGLKLFNFNPNGILTFPCRYGSQGHGTPLSNPPQPLEQRYCSWDLRPKKNPL
ncbi:hypothetical protein AVEN_238476-1 [Araneus ventricosus]|uniref:Endonuclease/exonuclease/phosphatase domain-containing protein n=1 Tax=Araneus ventricosus TaxID=182803 RepID=A0A4Y2SKR7_ARAVE|nr:hypothetical protein AVEN_238476-1 [Araneus ventricosus]